jgi:hypothetical protein
VDSGGQGGDRAPGGGGDPPRGPPRLLAGWTPRPRVTALALAAYVATTIVAVALAGALARNAEPREAVEVMTSAGLAALGGTPALLGVVLALRRAAPELRPWSVMAIGVLGAVAAPAVFVGALTFVVTGAEVVEAWPAAPRIPDFAAYAAGLVRVALTGSVIVLPVTLVLGVVMSGILWFLWSLSRPPPSRPRAASADEAPGAPPSAG